MGYEQVHSKAAAENLRRAAHDAATRIDYLEGQNQRLRESRDRWREKAEASPSHWIQDAVNAMASEEDSREKLEADIARFWGVTWGDHYYSEGEIAEVCIGWLDRQEEITRKELANG